jgi:hypothetical protein
MNYSIKHPLLAGVLAATSACFFSLTLELRFPSNEHRRRQSIYISKGILYYYYTPSVPATKPAGGLPVLQPPYGHDLHGARATAMRRKKKARRG